MFKFDVCLALDGKEEMVTQVQTVEAAFAKMADYCALCNDECFAELLRARGVDSALITVWGDDEDGYYNRIARYMVKFD